MALDTVNALNTASNKIGLSKKAGKLYQSIGDKLENSPVKDGFYKLMRNVDPTGANNAFIPMASLMLGTVIVPRVLTAAKRNPDDKEATKDEIHEILFRDIQTVAIVLFALKSINSLVAGATTKITGLPMTQKPYQSVFNTTEKGVKGFKEKAKEFIDTPVEKLKIIGKNILDTIHPTEGVRALTNDEFSSRYSNYNSIAEIEKLLDEIKSEKGNPDKIFDGIMDSLIKEQKTTIANTTKLRNAGITQDTTKAQEILKNLETLKETGIKGLSEDKLDENVKNQLVKYFQNENNDLTLKAKGLNAWLRTGALLFEAAYLGFGLPILNEKRLEKKYLGANKTTHFDYENKRNNNPLMNKHIKSNEVKLFHHFIK